ncbi:MULTISPECIES: RNA polymerase sigma factor [Larkinella]|uniref:Sigma-70 family RNA polymerase sigma factor n=2 Tax=Larkinella TaxID=332157 RepID=A0A5N1JFE1_9BACT|nr:MULTISPECIES: sigma-70 family RNA polymerase sigma factor [Larkinella]KAA9353825.1 sigma-70 family RNA polymerase sigma factor [Larkinella humicola]RCR69248.1 sigma-70 family RNA polymerase sigma factor [Larkinella punicea]
MIRRLLGYSTEMQLITALQRADSRAQKALFERYSSKMLTICVRYVSNRYEAEEILMDGFMRVFEKIGQYKSEGSFEGWIRRIMVNESLMYLRKNKQWRAEIALEDAAPEADTTFADQDLMAEDLMNLLEQLPAGYKTVFNLYAIEGYSHAEIAESLGITESTSKSQLHRARALLQRLLTQLDVKKKSISYEPASY